jgi:tetratricopeptide (TPR) repeat protein
MHFVSYSRHDGSDFVAQLERAFASVVPALALWIDRRGIRPGQVWDDEVDQALVRSDTMLFVMTKQSVRRQSICKVECQRALKYKKPVIPLRVDREAEVPFLLEGRQWVDFTADVEAGLSELRAHLEWLGTPQGQLRQVEDRLHDAQRDLDVADSPLERSRLRKEIEQLESQFAEQQQIVRDPERATREADERIKRALDDERAHGADGRDRAVPKRINRPPTTASDCFQDRRHETALLEEYLRGDLVRMVTITSGSSAGKTAMACRLLENLLEGRQPPSEPMEIDGVVYLSARKPHVVTMQNFLGDVAKLLAVDEASRLDERFRDTTTSVSEKLSELLDALAGRRVVVLVDGIEELIDDDQPDLHDPDLEAVLRGLLVATHHRVKVILTSRRPLPEGLAEAEPVRQRQLDLDEGLPPPYAENLLRSLDRDGTAGLRDAPADRLELARQRTNGNPLALEMLFAILSADRHTSLDDLLAETRGHSPTDVVETFLVRATLSRLDQGARRVVEALAVYQSPVRPEAIDHLLRPYVVGPDSRPVLDRLVDLQVVRRDGEHYQLPAKYWDPALASIPRGEPTDAWHADGPPYTRLALLQRGANYFEQARRSTDTYQGIEDVTAQLMEFDLRLRGDDDEFAAHVLLGIDYEYLLPWGYATEVLERHGALLGKLEDPRLEQASVGMIGTAYFRLGRTDEAIHYYERAMEIARALGDDELRKPWVTNLGSAYYERGQVRAALALYQEALELARSAGNNEAEAWPLAGLCLCYAEMGKLDVAKVHGIGALAIARDSSDPRHEQLEAEQLATLGCIHGQTGEPDIAKRRLRQALSQAQGSTYRSLEGHCLADLAEVLLDQNHGGEAIDLATEALKINVTVGNLKLGRSANYVLGLAYLFAGELAQARSAADQASSHAPMRWSHCGPLLRGVVALRQGEIEAASEAFEDALVEAGERLELGTDSFAVLDTKGLALAGLVVCGKEQRLTDASDAFSLARQMTRAKGVVGRVVRLLDTIAAADERGLLDRVRPAAAGEDPA